MVFGDLGNRTWIPNSNATFYVTHLWFWSVSIPHKLTKRQSLWCQALTLTFTLGDTRSFNSLTGTQIVSGIYIRDCWADSQGLKVMTLSLTCHPEKPSYLGSGPGMYTLKTRFLAWRQIGHWTCSRGYSFLYTNIDNNVQSLIVMSSLPSSPSKYFFLG